MPVSGTSPGSQEDFSNPYLYPLGPPAGSAGSQPFAPSTGSRGSTFAPNSPSAFIPAGGSTQPVESSKSALISMIFGLLSLPLMCVGLSLFSSIAAIILGHVGLGNIRKSKGTLTGKGFANTGLALGYPIFLLSVMFFGWVIYSASTAPRRNQDQPVWETPEFTRKFPVEKEVPTLVEEKTPPPKIMRPVPDDALGKLEHQLQLLSSDEVSGNSRSAESIAFAFQEKMSEFSLRDPTRPYEIHSNDRLGNCKTYCELNSERCLLLLESDRVAYLSEHMQFRLQKDAWLQGRFALLKNSVYPKQLAIGLCNDQGYQIILIDSIAETSPKLYLNREDLLSFLSGKKADGTPLTTPDQDARVARVEKAIDKYKSAPPIVEPRQPAGVGASPSFTPTPNATTTPEASAPIDIEKESIFAAEGGEYASFQASAFSSDNSRLAVSASRNSVWIYDLRAKRKIQEISQVDSLEITALAFSPDGNHLFAGGRSGKVFWWENKRGTYLPSVHKLTGHLVRVNYLLPARNGKFLISSGGDGKVLWQQLGGTGQSKEKNLNDGIKFVCQTDDDLKIWACSEFKVYTLDLRTADSTQMQFPDEKQSFSRGFSRDGSRAWAANLGEVVIWDVNAKKTLNKFKADSLAPKLVMSPDGEHLWETGASNVIVWEARTGKELARLALPRQSYSDPIEFSPDGKFVALGSLKPGRKLFVIPYP